MGIFDRLFGGKNKNNNEKEFIRANSDDCEDMGVVTHYKGKPLTGMHMSDTGTSAMAFSLNKVTGEVRKYNTYYQGIEGKGDKQFNVYRVTEVK